MKGQKRGKDRRNKDKGSENRGSGRGRKEEEASSGEEDSDDEFLPREDDDEVRQSHNSLTIEKLPADLFFVKIKRKKLDFKWLCYGVQKPQLLMKRS